MKKLEIFTVLFCFVALLRSVFGIFLTAVHSLALSLWQLSIAKAKNCFRIMQIEALEVVH
jgi:hypothetical protein